MNERNTNITLLKTNEISKNNTLDVIKKYGNKAVITDLFIVLGGRLSENVYNSVNDINYTGLKNRTSDYWICNLGPSAVKITSSGNEEIECKSDRTIGIRPVLESQTVYNQVIDNKKESYNKTYEVEYGYYPQYAANNEMQIELENKFNAKELNKTGNKYTFDSVLSYDEKNKFNPVSYDEYEYLGKRYVRIINCDTSIKRNKRLSNGNIYRYKDAIWIEVTPVKWLVDEQNKRLISKQIIATGIRYDDKNLNKTFEESELNYYLNNYMLKELLQRADLKIIEERIKELEKQISYLKEDKNKLKKQTQEKIQEYYERAIEEYINKSEESNQNKQLLFK